MNVQQQQLDELHHRVTSFMNANYPCNCVDDECPGETHEAFEIVSIVKETLNLSILLDK